jgi:hypothetical protein
MGDTIDHVPILIQGEILNNPIRNSKNLKEIIEDLEVHNGSHNGHMSDFISLIPMIFKVNLCASTSKIFSNGR